VSNLALTVPLSPLPYPIDPRYRLGVLDRLVDAMNDMA
jgi:hypothetical protein